jgi:hypothetical protein
MVGQEELDTVPLLLVGRADDCCRSCVGSLDLQVAATILQKQSHRGKTSVVGGYYKRGAACCAGYDVWVCTMLQEEAKAFDMIVLTRILKCGAVLAVDLVHIYPTGLKQVSHDIISSLESCIVQGFLVPVGRVGFFWVYPFFFNQTLHFCKVSRV